LKSNINLLIALL